MTNDKTLTAAVLTPVGRGAVATIRVVGDLSQLDDAAVPLFRAANGRALSQQELRRIAFGRWGREDAEEIVVSRLTGATLELHCHGGDAAVRRILNDLQQAGCAVVDWPSQMAACGESLDAECLDALSRATTWRTAEILLEQSNGLLREALERLRSSSPLSLRLGGERARVRGPNGEDAINSSSGPPPESSPHPNSPLKKDRRVGPAALRRAGPPPSTATADGGPALETSLSHPTDVFQQAANPLPAGVVSEDRAGREDRIADLNALLAWADFGLHLTRPWSVVLTGRPNVGKSSLINRLLGYERAIVFDQPGTTRDVVTGETAFDGWPVLLADTAGLRDATEELEAAGIALSRARLATADLKIVLIDLGEPPTDDDQRLLAEWPDGIVVAHKCDRPDRWLSHQPAGAMRVSSRTGEGIDELQRRLVERLVPRVPPPGTAIPISVRQVELLRTARMALAVRDEAAFTICVESLLDVTKK